MGRMVKRKFCPFALWDHPRGSGAPKFNYFVLGSIWTYSGNFIHSVNIFLNYPVHKEINQTIVISFDFVGDNNYSHSVDSVKELIG